MPDFIAIPFESIRSFMELGGPVLYLIAALLVAMWYMILDRILYFYFEHKTRMNSAIQEWEARGEKKSWVAHQIREEIVSKVSIGMRKNLPLIQSCVALAPLFGLLGTVTGMIEVFQVMAITGSSNAKAMAGGVSRATVPTMAGMVAALSGLFLSFWLQRKCDSERDKLSESLVLEHD